ncbi:MAG: HNH endonuclease signature motif containing protein [Ilumatobacteraceae bacterium]
MRTARLLADIEAVRNRLAAGEVGVAQVHELARAYANPRAAVRMPEFADILLEHARTLPFEDFRVVVGQWEALADQDGSERAHEVSHRNRRASLHVDGHHTWLDASGGNIDGAQMREIFDRYCQAEYLADWADARDRHGDLASAHDLPRTGRQRAWDALLRIFLDAASTPADAQPPEPVLHVAGDVHTVTDVLAALVAHLDSDTLSSGGVVVPDRPHDPAHARCATVTGVQLPRSAILDALLFGRLRRVVFDGAGVPVDVGRRRRFFTDAMRDALAVHTSRCVYVGCEQPLHRLQTDHLHSHAHGGATATHNGSLLCGHHNRIKNHGFTVWRDPGGLWHTYRPDGTELTPT